MSLLVFSCNVKTNDETEILKSDFKLKSDFTELTKKMTKLDTIKIWANLSSCMWMCTEKMILTKSNDSLIIDLKVIQMRDPEVSETIKIHINDSIWNFNKFLNNNKDRLLKTTERNEINLSIRHKSDSIDFYTGNLGDLNRFIQDYYKSMFILKPKNKAYEFMLELNNEAMRVEGIPVTAIWSGKEGKGNWFDIEWVNNHKNKTRIAIYDEKSGKLIIRKIFMKICPIDESKFIENLRLEIDFYDGEKIQLKDNCYLQ